MIMGLKFLSWSKRPRMTTLFGTMQFRASKGGGGVGFWVELQCKRKRWKEQSPQPFPDCLHFFFFQFCQKYFSHSETVLWAELQCKRKRWKEQSPQPFPDCLRFLNVYSTVNFHLPPPQFSSLFFFSEISY